MRLRLDCHVATFVAPRNDIIRNMDRWGANINALFVEKQEAIVYNKKLALCARIRARTKK